MISNKREYKYKDHVWTVCIMQGVSPALYVAFIVLLMSNVTLITFHFSYSHWLDLSGK